MIKIKGKGVAWINSKGEESIDVVVTVGNCILTHSDIRKINEMYEFCKTHPTEKYDLRK